MTTVTFDTLQLVEKSKSTELLSKTDLDLALVPLKTDLAIMKWMIGILLAGVISLVLKAFF